MNIQEGLFWLILTVYFEGRGELASGQKNIAKVILNRAHKNNWPLADVVRARKQFSCFNDNPAGMVKVVIKEIAAVAVVTRNVLAAIDEWEEGDNLSGATHYYAPKAMVPPGRAPSWAPKMQRVCQFGGHIFFKES